MARPPTKEELATYRNRQRRYLARLDKQLGRRSKPAVATPEQRARALARDRELRDLRESYRELQQAVLREGGLRTTRDYGREEIPPDVRRPKGNAPDEMPLRLQSYGFHYERADDLIDSLHRRRDAYRDALSRRPRTGAQLVCMDLCRDHRGRFVRS